MTRHAVLLYLVLSTVWALNNDRRVPTLRLASNYRPPQLTREVGQVYMLFLSHVWSTGQVSVPWWLGRPSAIVSGSQHLPEGAAPPQGDRHTSPAVNRCAKGEGGVWVNPGGGDRRYSGCGSPAYGGCVVAAWWLRDGCVMAG